MNTESQNTPVKSPIRNWTDKQLYSASYALAKTLPKEGTPEERLKDMPDMLLALMLEGHRRGKPQVVHSALEAGMQ